ncbi:uncharacterized protein LOC123523851 [Mercenaria mercenaria]|uniref:uncharacterized protein LOC123523851 n=1 Tax=Mercenaria mercenaria TaxID=6596 RepID=UPI00234F7BC7|nr:uncharacterized protein LOC123523851 [Mercenaria mercenaria]XP_053395465.1 uncharacterized protein LOC123523851 [Mercenaria mercenaria]
MFQQPGYIENVSLRLSEVLADVGVDERIVKKRRKTWLLKESMETIAFKLRVYNKNVSSYFLGSQSEGTTTRGLKSDMDRLFCHNNINVIQDWADWEPGVRNYLMIQDETVSPGYCLLQRLRDDAPLPYNDVFNEHHFRDRMGRILQKNTVMSAAAAEVLEGGVRHGPAYAQQELPGLIDTDTVSAYPCKSWPLQARQFLVQQGVGQWPSDDMKRYCSSTGCFVVGVGSKENEELEWRISTSLAERCLMFNLNITQIRCYVLMKMILKTFIKPYFEDTISSFMCKTVLFHCIANTHSYVWRENNLLLCLSLCIFVLYSSILNENCPHFIIPGNNLMRGHIPHDTKPYILEILQYIINSEGRALLEIECDALGNRIQLKLSNLLLEFDIKTSDIISGQLLKITAEYINMAIRYCLTSIKNSSYIEAIQTLLKCIFKLVIISNQCQGLNKTASSLLVSCFCTTLGSILASLNIQQYNAIPAEALTWISLGLNTDVASSKLKLASMLYCIGDTQRTEVVLRDIEANYDLNIVEPICMCHNFIKQPLRRGFNAICDNHNEEAIQYTTAFCVRFLPCEINCVPHELRQEMFRSTQEDLAFRGRYDYWMDWAVVDSLPYLYFLQYKTCSNIGRHEDQQTALSNLMRTIDQEPNLGHRETALNLLGQCMEQEDRARDSLQCYLLSLNLRERNNAATFHICRLLSTLVNDQ